MKCKREFNLFLQKLFLSSKACDSLSYSFFLGYHHKLCFFSSHHPNKIRKVMLTRVCNLILHNTSEYFHQFPFYSKSYDVMPENSPLKNNFQFFFLLFNSIFIRDTCGIFSRLKYEENGFFGMEKL